MYAQTFRRSKRLKLEHSAWRNIVCGFLIICLVWLSTGIIACREVEAAEQDLIRLAWKKREHFNPLKTFDESGRAVLPLVYRGLFVIDDAEALRTDLASDAEWSADHLSLKLNLKKDESFSNGKALTAQDAALSILYYRFYLEEYLLADRLQLENSENEEGEETSALGPERDYPQNYILDSSGNNTTPEGQGTDNEEETDRDSDGEQAQAFSYQAQLDYLYGLRSDPYHLKALRAIGQIEIQDSHSLIIHLKEVTDSLPWCLTLPIIPEDKMEEFSGLIPGIGNYKFSKQGERLFLEPVSKAQGGSHRLELLSYDTFSKALEAFSDGKLDLLFCPAAYFLNLSLRSDLKTISQETSDYYYLKCGFASEFPLARLDNQRLLREGLSYSPASRYITSDWPYVLHQRDWRRTYARQYSALTDQENLAAWQALREALGDHKLLLAAESNSYNRYVMDGLSDFFRQLALPIELLWLPPDQYTAFAQSGRYDLLLCHTDLSYPLDAQLLRQEIYDLSPYLAYNLPVVGRDDLITPLFAYAWNLEDEQLPATALADYYRNVQDSLVRSGIFELFFAPQGLLIGQRLSGNQHPPAWDVYRGIEDFIICD